MAALCEDQRQMSVFCSILTRFTKLSSITANSGEENTHGGRGRQPDSLETAAFTDTTNGTRSLGPCSDFTNGSPATSASDTKCNKCQPGELM